jgi:hypothetical protein
MTHTWYPLEKEHPKLELKIVIDDKNRTLRFVGNKTPSKLVGKGIIYSKKKDLHVKISSFSFPAIEYRTSDYEISFYLGGESDNYDFDLRYTYLKSDINLLIKVLNECFHTIKLNKKIKVL